MNELLKRELDRITKERDYYNLKAVELKIEQKNYSDYEKLIDMFHHVNSAICNIAKKRTTEEEKTKLEINTADLYLKKISTILEKYN